MSTQRTIKFRAWHEGHGRKHPAAMHYEDRPGDALKWLAEGQPVNVMQYTGLKDKNGREIYEGDIIDSGGKRGSDGSAILYAVKWSDAAMGFDLQQLGSYCMTGGVDAKKVVVIGNIYENPELIEA